MDCSRKQTCQRHTPRITARPASGSLEDPKHQPRIPTEGKPPNPPPHPTNALIHPQVRVLFNQQGSMHTDIAPTPTLPLSTLYPSTFPAPSTEPPKPFTPSPKTGGALTLGPSDATVTKPTPWILTLDTSPTPPSPHTLLKTTHRAHYDAARARSQPATPPPGPNQLHEVLLWNTVDEMTEGSFTSVYFFRGGRWVTPPVGVPQRQEEEDGSAVVDEGELREPFAGRWGHSVRSAKAVAGSGGQRGTTRRWALKKGLCMEEPVGRGTVRVGEEVWVSNGVRGFGRGRVVEARGTVG